MKQRIIDHNNDLVLSPLKRTNFGEICNGKECVLADLKWEESEDEIFFFSLNFAGDE